MELRFHFKGNYVQIVVEYRAKFGVLLFSQDYLPSETYFEHLVF